MVPRDFPFSLINLGISVEFLDTPGGAVGLRIIWASVL